jgi:hypothetical protein
MERIRPDRRPPGRLELHLREVTLECYSVRRLAS